MARPTTWLKGPTGYGILNAIEYGAHLKNADNFVKLAARADTTQSAVACFSAAQRELRKAIRALGTVSFDIEYPTED